MPRDTGAPRSASVVAREHSVAFEVRKDTKAGIFRTNPALVERVAEMIAQREPSEDRTGEPLMVEAARH